MTNFEKIRKTKYFKKTDIFIYVVIAMLIIFLFFFVSWNTNAQSLKGICVKINENGQDQTVFIYDFATDVWTVDEKWKDSIVVLDGGGKLTVKIKFDDEFNLLTIDKTDRYAKMTDADCSFRRDCTLFPPITDGGGVIICIPHGLTVTGIGEADLQPGVG